MNRKKLVILLWAFVSAFAAKAQEEIVCDQYHFNYYLVDPAVAGAERCHHLMLTGKFQWVGMDDAPRVQTLSFRTRVIKNIGLGAYVYNDKNGYSYRQGGQATFAYHIPLSENSGYFMKERSIDRQLSFGISAVVNHYNFSEKLFDEANMFDSPIGNGDKDKGFYFNANVGTYFVWDNFFFGASASNLLKTEKVEMGEDEPVDPMTIYAFAGYDIDLTDKMTLEPGLMFKTNENDSRQLDVNIKFMQTLPDNEDFSYWLEASYRHCLDEGNSQSLLFSPMGGIRWKRFHLAYAYGLGLTKINHHNSGTHEVMLGYTWCVTKHFCR